MVYTMDIVSVYAYYNALSFNAKSFADINPGFWIDAEPSREL